MLNSNQWKYNILKADKLDLSSDILINQYPTLEDQIANEKINQISLFSQTNIEHRIINMLYNANI